MTITNTIANDLEHTPTMTVQRARRIISAHGFATEIWPAADGTEALHALIPYSQMLPDGRLISGVDSEHVSDFDPASPVVRTARVREALGY